jgi:hypothetical protein
MNLILKEGIAIKKVKQIYTKIVGSAVYERRLL